MRRTRVAAALLSTFLVAPLLGSSALGREGFGFSKRAAKLNRQVPPEIYLAAEKLDVRLEKTGPSEDAARKFRDAVEAKLTGFDRSLTVDPAKPDVIVKLSFDDSDYNEAFETKTDTEYKQTGTKQEWNAKKGKYETKPVYDNVTVYKSFKRVTGAVRARYEVVDGKARRKIHSASVESDYNQAFENGAGAPGRYDLEKKLIDGAAGKIAAQLVGSTELVAVLLPRGSFDSFVALAEQGSWDRYFAGVQSVAAKNRPGDEAYRQYALGVANEAMAYRAGTMDEAVSFLRTAEGHYMKAPELKPDEKLFTQAYANVWTGGEGSAPIERVKSAIANYERLREFKSMGSRAANAPRPVPSSKPGSRPSKVLRNDSLIEMARAGLTDENIVLAIEGASATEFDLTPDGLIALSRAGVSKNVIAFVQKRDRKRP